MPGASFVVTVAEAAVAGALATRAVEAAPSGWDASGSRLSEPCSRLRGSEGRKACRSSCCQLAWARANGCVRQGCTSACSCRRVPWATSCTWVEEGACGWRGCGALLALTSGSTANGASLASTCSKASKPDSVPCALASACRRCAGMFWLAGSSSVPCSCSWLFIGARPSMRAVPW